MTEEITPLKAELLEELTKYIERNPELRFGQALFNFSQLSSLMADQINPFYIQDEVFLKAWRRVQREGF